MKSYRDISVFVAHSFNPECGSYERDELRRVLREVFDSVATDLELDRLEYKVQLNFEFSDYQETITDQLHRLLDEVDLGIVELSDNNRNVLYELGYMTAKGIPSIILKSKRSKALDFDMPVDISARFYCEYGDVTELATKLLSNVLDNLKSVIRNRRIEKSLMNRIWFPENTQIVHIVCAQEYETVSSQKLTSPYYTHLDNLCDKDALLEMMLFLSRNYGEARLVKYSDAEFSVRQSLKDNLVLVGGPGSPEVRGGNTITRIINQRIDSRIKYSDDCETMIVRRNGEVEELQASVSSKGVITKDFGYFARFLNPFNPLRSVILIHGIHTNGVLGAAQVFSDKIDARSNFGELLHAIDVTKDLAFECFFEVEVFDGDVITPRLKRQNVFLLDQHNQ